MARDIFVRCRVAETVGNRAKLMVLNGEGGLPIKRPSRCHTNQMGFRRWISTNSYGIFGMYWVFFVAVVQSPDDGPATEK